MPAFCKPGSEVLFAVVLQYRTSYRYVLSLVAALQILLVCRTKLCEQHKTYNYVYQILDICQHIA